MGVEVKNILDNRLLLYYSELIVVCVYGKLKSCLAGAFREPTLINVKCSSSSPVALKLTSIIGLESKL